VYRNQPAISSRVRKQPEQWPVASSAHTLMQGDMGLTAELDSMVSDMTLP
jgi:hypothetical protein